MVVRITMALRCDNVVSLYIAKTLLIACVKQHFRRQLAEKEAVGSTCASNRPLQRGQSFIVELCQSVVAVEAEREAADLLFRIAVGMAARVLRSPF